ncbi:succinate dehydrogenase, hydrophobic membrane anchor protein [Steroidobacter sp.]|uniref:succinate dehydrogenase, hydrophobic membrane anchor protein n=1 Tax=Steroidobacter sp. TaxID=1978227 RepID=UPI001A5B6B71|nr:succinate dehydrogenase, hydrophobic membrane anchor protein [Steroidobacter sp.]MBL8264871.1 succinate dehydrogenase, hydrophobic membrane anchor protein [Steroidobacter sp.]
MSLRSPVGRVLGLGSAGEGVGHWWTQRVTSVALVLLGLWFVFSLVHLPDLAYTTLVAWLASPVNAVLLALLVGTSLYHSLLGVQVVVEDYVSNHGTKIVTMLVLQFLHIVLGALGIFSVLRVAFGSAQ